MGAASGPDAAAWVPVRTADGSWTLRHPVHGETCHSAAGAWTEAVERYARPTRLAERAARRAAEGGEPLDLIDVGTGLGLNLAAALRAVETAGGRLRAVTLERSPAVLRAACSLAGAAGEEGEPWHARVRAALARALERRRPGEGKLDAGPLALGGGSTLRLVLGDARETLAGLEAGARFDAVLLDPFSPRREPELWDARFLEEVARRMRPGAWLSTYTASLAVRCALATAGLRVGAGPRVGAKAAGTLASPDGDPPPLAPRTVRRLGRRLGRPLGRPLGRRPAPPAPDPPEGAG